MSARLKLYANNITVIILLLALCMGGCFLIFWLISVPYAPSRLPENFGAIAARYFSFSSVLVLCLTGVGGIVIMGSAAKNFIMPLQRLKVAAAEIRDGNLDYELVFTGTDDFSEVNRSFEEMRVRLKDSNREKQAAEKERSAMMASICHDLKTPITSIMGYTEGILDGVADTPEKVKDYVRVINKKAQSLQQLADDLSLLSRLENSQLELKRTPSDIGALCREIVQEFSEETPGMRLTSDVQPGLVCDVDREKIGRVLVNLLQNSVKYRRPEQEAPIIELRVSESGDDALIALSDCGIGISRESMPRVFDRFFRADESRSVVKGSGLGLSIVRQIISLHRGRTWMRPAESGGVTVCILLPLSKNRTGGSV